MASQTNFTLSFPIGSERIMIGFNDYVEAVTAWDSVAKTVSNTSLCDYEGILIRDNFK